MKKPLMTVGCKEIVPYNYKYHAEIRFETTDGFNFCNANGNTIDELLFDINQRFDYFEHREPKIVKVLENPNTDNKEITKEIIEIYYSRGSK